MLRDERVYEQGPEALDELADSVRDANFRIFAEGNQLHLVSAGLHLTGVEPFDLFDQLLQTGRKNVDVTHAFYLGFELSKALTALTLNKQYNQDQALNWGYLTVPETKSHGKHKRDTPDPTAGSTQRDGADAKP